MSHTKCAVSLLAIAGLAAVTQAQALVQLEVSSAGAEQWSNTFNEAIPGGSVDVRVKVSYNGTAQPLGLASMYMQPTVSNWRTTGSIDTLAPLHNAGQGSNISNPSGGVFDAVGQFGRITPYANRSTSGSLALTGFVQAVSGTTYLRIAQAYATDWIGTGFNATGGRGIPISQLNDVGRTSFEPAFANSTQNVVVFKFRINLSADPGGRSLTVNIPPDAFGNLNTSTNTREIRWYANMSEATGSIVGAATVVPATINLIIPSPASLAALGMGGLVLARRRRC